VAYSLHNVVPFFSPSIHWAFHTGPLNIRQRERHGHVFLDTHMIKTRSNVHSLLRVSIPVFASYIISNGGKYSTLTS
jgi:hypothetical protein